MVLTAATLWAVNGVVSKVIIESGDVSAQRLTEVRTTGAFALLFLALVLSRPGLLRVRRKELPVLLTFGLLGLAFVQWFYFEAISRLDIGVALLIQYVAPVLVALWARFVYDEPVRRRIWAALALSILGIALLVELWNGLTLDRLGVAASSLQSAPSPAVTRSRSSATASCSRRSSGPSSSRGRRFPSAAWTRASRCWGGSATSPCRSGC
jgi:drug/metabolite transporter (DMT)-like permease